MSNELSRRAFVAVGARGALTVGAGLLLAACGGATAGTPAPSGGTSGGSQAGSSKLKLPTYAPVKGPQPDLPGAVDGVPPAYFAFPKNLVKAVAQAPGKGGDVNVMTYTVQAPPPPLESNAMWQALNKQLNATLKMPSINVADYPTKLATVMASGDLPDMFTISVNGSIVQDEPKFLSTTCADLTDYLGGDAVKDFPNLANLPPSAWPYGVFGGRIYGVPRVTNNVGPCM